MPTDPPVRRLIGVSVGRPAGKSSMWFIGAALLAGRGGAG